MLKAREIRRTFAPSRSVKSRVVAVGGVSLDVAEGALFTLLGPSGCGKTTTLRCIAGLDVPDSGHVTVGDRVLFSSSDGINVPSNERGLGMVFQSYAIWPHMDVFRNVAFPLQVLPLRSRPKMAELRRRVERALDVVQLGSFAGRRATDLSGGQQQRLALARALVMEPPVLLLDEPLSNLDAKLREAMRFELKRLQRELGITTVYVTHDQVEALSISTQIAVMNGGVVEQTASPRELYEQPSSQFVADFVGITNFSAGRVAERVGVGQFLVDTPYGGLVGTTGEEFAPGDNVVVSSRPEHIGIREAAQGETIRAGVWRGKVKERAFLGECLEYVVSVGDRDLRVRTVTDLRFPPGTEVDVEFRPERNAILRVGD